MQRHSSPIEDHKAKAIVFGQSPGLLQIVKFFLVSLDTKLAGQASQAVFQGTSLLEGPKYHWNK